MNGDPIVDEVRMTRERLAREHGFDVGAIFEDLRKRQGALGRRLVRRERKQIGERVAAPARDSAVLHPGR